MIMLFQVQGNTAGVSLDWVQWVQLNPWIFRPNLNETEDSMENHLKYRIGLTLLIFQQSLESMGVENPKDASVQ